MKISLHYLIRKIRDNLEKTTFLITESCNLFKLEHNNQEENLSYDSINPIWHQIQPLISINKISKYQMTLLF